MSKFFNWLLRTAPLRSFDAIRLNEAVLCGECEVITPAMGSARCPVCQSTALVNVANYVRSINEAMPNLDNRIGRLRRRQNLEVIYNKVMGIEG